MTCLRLAVVAALTLSSSMVLTAEQSDIKTQYSKSEFRIPMRDGVHLFTVVYAPRDASTTFPILMTRTPYGVDPYGRDAYRTSLGPSANFVQDGFIFVYQDVRGRYMSEGEFVEMRPEENPARGTDESTDTYDTIDWLLKNLPNNNGKVGLIGTSYPGFYTSAGLINAHPALITMAHFSCSPTSTSTHPSAGSTILNSLQRRTTTSTMERRTVTAFISEWVR